MRFNGRRETDFVGTVGELLVERNLPLRGVAVAINGEIVPRSLWDSTPIPKDGDIEVVTAAAGG